METYRDDDSRLVQASLVGDREAFRKIVQRYQGLVCAIAYSSTGDPAQSEDLAQETFIRAWQKLDRLRERPKLGAWLAGIARNVAGAYLRQRRRTPTSQAAPIESRTDLPDRGAPSPLQAAMAREQEAIVWEALKRIPESSREALVLYYREDKSVRQVAEALGIGEEAAKGRLHRGRLLLKEEVGRIVEDTLVRTRPGGTFAAGVVAALPAALPGAGATAGGGLLAQAAAAAKGGSIGPAAGALATPLLWVLALVHGAMANVALTFSRRERRFVFWATWGCVVLAAGLVITITRLARHVTESGLSPQESRWVLGGFALGSIVVLFLAVAFATRRQRRIQIEEEGGAAECCHAEHGVAAAAYGAYAACAAYVVAGTGWLAAVAWLVNDHLSLALTALVAAAAFAAAAWRCRRAPRRSPAIMLQTIGVMMLFALALLNWRWTHWIATGHSPAMTHWLAMYGRLGWSAIVAGLYLFLWQRVRWDQRRDAMRRAGARAERPRP